MYTVHDCTRVSGLRGVLKKPNISKSIQYVFANAIELRCNVRVQCTVRTLDRNVILYTLHRTRTLCADCYSNCTATEGARVSNDEQASAS